MLVEFFSGVIVGVAGLAVIALHFANKAAKPKAEAAPQGIAATSVSMNGGNATLDSYHARLMAAVIKNIEGQA
jgi:hypothetical protein